MNNPRAALDEARPLPLGTIIKLFRRRPNEKVENQIVRSEAIKAAS